MSLPALSHVLYKVHGIDPTAKLVLLAIADHIHSETGWAWPSTTRLAELAEVSPRSVIRHVEALEQKGLLEVDRQQGKANGYRIPLPATHDTSVTGPEPTSDTHDTTTSDACGTGPEPTGDIYDTGSQPTHDTHVTATHDAGDMGGTTTRDTGVTLTVKELEEDEEEDVDALARIDARVTLVSQILPASWAETPVLCDDPGLDVLDQLVADGWTPTQLRAACATLPKSRSNPTALLVRHLGHHRGRPASAITHSRRPTPTPDQPTECAHGAPSGSWCHDCQQERPW